MEALRGSCLMQYEGWYPKLFYAFRGDLASVTCWSPTYTRTAPLLSTVIQDLGVGDPLCLFS
ncbi:hypothetical protein GQ600_11480 [Phytophthora cactorum]|nr:hypothetical protein GQ600_11480 [Phytophthora cactorum]